MRKISETFRLGFRSWRKGAILFPFFPAGWQCVRGLLGRGRWVMGGQRQVTDKKNMRRIRQVCRLKVGKKNAWLKAGFNVGRRAVGLGLVAVRSARGRVGWVAYAGGRMVVWGGRGGWANDGLLTFMFTCALSWCYVVRSYLCEVSPCIILHYSTHFGSTL